MKTFRKLLLVPVEEIEKNEITQNNKKNIEIEQKNSEIKNILNDKKLSGIRKVIEIDKKQDERINIVKPEDLEKLNIETLNKNISNLFKKKIPKAQKISLINSEIFKFKNLFNKNTSHVNYSDNLINNESSQIQQEPITHYPDVFSNLSRKRTREEQSLAPVYNDSLISKKPKLTNKKSKILKNSTKELLEYNPLTTAQLVLNNTYDDEDNPNVNGIGKFERFARIPDSIAKPNLTRNQLQSWQNFNQK